MSLFAHDETRRDEDDFLRDLIERQHLIIQMQQTEGWKLWSDYLAAVAQGYQNRLLRGLHKDMLDYKFDAGTVQGIRLALGVSEDLQARIDAAREVLALSQPLADQEENDEHAGV